MAERKFRNFKPRKPAEFVEGLYEELSLSQEMRPGYKPVETLKDYVAELLKCERESERRQEREKERKSYAIDQAQWGLFFLAVALLICGAKGSEDWLWFETHKFAIRLWGFAFAVVFVGVSIERSSFFKSLWSFGFTKIIASLAFSAIFVFSTGKASSLINSVFHVDAAALPFTRAFVSGLLIFQYSYPLLLIVALFACIHAIDIIYWIRKGRKEDGYQFPPFKSFAFLALSVTVLIFSTVWVYRYFAPDLWPAKIYQLAHELDFNSKYECANLPDGLSVIFLGPEQDRVLVDTQKITTEGIEGFVDTQLSRQIEVPERLYVLPCIVKPPPEAKNGN